MRSGKQLRERRWADIWTWWHWGFAHPSWKAPTTTKSGILLIIGSYCSVSCTPRQSLKSCEVWMSRTSAHRAHTMGLLDLRTERETSRWPCVGEAGPQAMEGWTVLGLKPSFPMSCYEDYKGEGRGKEGGGTLLFQKEWWLRRLLCPRSPVWVLTFADLWHHPLSFAWSPPFHLVTLQPSREFTGQEGFAGFSPVSMPVLPPEPGVDLRVLGSFACVRAEEWRGVCVMRSRGRGSNLQLSALWDTEGNVCG